MKRLLLCIVFVISTAASAMSQDRGFTWGVMTQIPVENKGLTPYNVEVNLGYSFNATWALLAKAETNISLFDLEGLGQAHYTTTAFGALVKCNFYKFNGGILDVRGGGGLNATSKDWKYAYFDGGVYIQATRNQNKPTMGIGVRHYNSRNDKYSNSTHVYVSIGFTVN